MLLDAGATDSRLRVRRLTAEDHGRYITEVKHDMGEAWDMVVRSGYDSGMEQFYEKIAQSYQAELDRYAFEESWAGPSINGEHNLILNAGADLMYKAARGDGSLTLWTTTNARVCIGDNNGSVTNNHAYTQTDLQASTNKVRVVVDSGWPKVPADLSGGIQGSNARIFQFQATATTGIANHQWYEFGIANAVAGSGTLLNRFVSNQGTKVAGQVWVVTIEFKIN